MIAPAARIVRRVSLTALVAADAAARFGRVRLASGGEDPCWSSRELHTVCRRVMSVHGIEVEVRGALPPPGALLVANHVSWLDPLAVIAATPALPIAKSEVGSWPIVGPLARGGGVQFVERHAPRSRALVVARIEQLLRRGASVLNFAEGTTTGGREVLPLRPASFRAAHDALAPIVPVAIRWSRDEAAWTGDATFLPHYLKTAAGEDLSVRLSFGAPIVAPDALAAATLARRFLQDEVCDAAAERV